MKKRIFLAGDSTVQSYKAGTEPQTGWGQVLYENFKGSQNCKIYPSSDSRFAQSMCYELDEVIIDNRAMAARSSRTFREEGRLEDIAECMKAGDYMLVQFAHNDANQGKPERYVPAEAFGASLLPFAELCRSRGALCIMVTAIAMRNCDDSPDGSFQISFPEYRKAMMDFAAKEDLVLLDMGKATTEYCGKLGGEECKKLFLWTKPGEYPDSTHKDGTMDNAHLQKRGAREFANILTNLVKDYRADDRLEEFKKWLR